MGITLVVGASGHLGSRVARQLLARGERVRASSRKPASLQELGGLGAEIAQADLRDPASLDRACAGVSAVVASVQAFGDADTTNQPPEIDGHGHRALIDAAGRAGIEHFVFVSVTGAAPDHPVEFWRLKHATERYLAASGLEHTIVRPAAFMEVWAQIIVGGPILASGKTTIFGAGRNPINFVSADDVARLIVEVLERPAARNRTLEIGGPQDLTLLDVAGAYERATGRIARKTHVPRLVMRLMAPVMLRLQPLVGRQMAAGVMLDTADNRLDSRATREEFGIEPTTLEDFVRRTVGPAAVAAPA